MHARIPSFRDAVVARACVVVRRCERWLEQCRATALRVPGDWTFGAGVTVVGDVTVEGDGGTIPTGTVLQG